MQSDIELNVVKQEINNCIQLLNSSTLCFTGHRSQKLPWKFDEKDIRCISMKRNLKKEIEKSINDGYNTFLCGMALGFDMICAETVISLKKKFPNIKIIGALPCKTQDLKWPQKERNRYHNLLEQLDGIRCIYNTYVGAKCMIERNHFMVNNSSKIIALFDGQNGGTKDTINYAKKQNLDIVIIKP